MPKEQTNFSHHGRVSVKIYRKIAFIFLGPVLILVGVVLAATLSRATITVTANKMPIATQAKVAVAAATNTSDTVRGKVFSVTLEDAATAAPKGDTVTRDAVATGKVTLVNKRAAPQTLIPTTRLLTPEGVLFRIKNRVTIPANGTLKDVEVYADKAGSSGNISPTSFTIPGLAASLQQVVYAESSAPISGGTITVRGVSPDDISSLVDGLKEKLIERAKASLANEIKASGYDGLASKLDEVSRNVSAKVGDSVDTLTASLKATITIVSYDRAKFASVALGNLSQAIPTDMHLESSNADKIDPAIQNADPAAGTATLSANVSGTATILPDNPILEKDRLTGLYADAIVGYLKSFSTISDAKVSLWPFWVRRTPAVGSHIKIIIE